jgi:hypothetical protein
MYVAFFGGLFFTLLGGSHKEWRWHILAGLIIGFGYESHQYVIRFVFAFGLVHLINYVRQTWQTKHLIVRHALIGYGIGLSLYTGWFMVFHVLVAGRPQDILETIQQMYNFQSSFFPIQKGEGLILVKNFQQYQLFLRSYPLSFVFGCMVLPYAIWRWKSADRLLLALFAASTLSGSLILAHSTSYYWVYFVPFVSLLSGRAIVEWGAGQLTHPQSPAPLTQLTLILITGLSLLLFTDTALLGIQPNMSRTRIKMGEQLTKVIPAQIHITGEPIYHIGMSERRNFTSVEQMARPNGVPLEQWAVVFTDHRKPPGLDYWIFAVDSGLKEAYCYPLQGIFVTRVFIAPNSPFFPEAPQLCSEP